MLHQINTENFHQMLGQFSTSELEGMIEKFPYFQQAHLLLAKKYQQENSPKFDQQLQLAALYVQDRELLYKLFNEKSVIPTPTKETVTIKEPELKQEIESPITEVQKVTQEVLPTITAEVTAEESQSEKPSVEAISEETDMAALLAEIEKTSKQIGSFTNAPVTENQKRAIEAKEEIIELRTEAPVETIEVKPNKEEIKETELISEAEVVENTAIELSSQFEPPVVEEVKEQAELSQTEVEATVTIHESISEPLAEESEEPALEEESMLHDEKPLEVFSRIQPHTFDEWLKAFNNKSVSERTEEPVVEKEELPEEKDELAELLATSVSVDYLHELVKEETTYAKGLERFIEEQIQKHKLPEVKKQAAENEQNTEPATETMAKVYEMQKKYSKAIKTYEALTLKFPEKSSLFAARINYLKNIV